MNAESRYVDCPPMPTREVINIKTTLNDKGELEIVWGDSSGACFSSYRVYGNRLQRKAELTRQALDTLKQAYILPHPDFIDAIVPLVNSGHELRKAIFADHLPEDTTQATEAKAWFEEVTQNSASNVVVFVHAEPKLSIPWGLLHEHGTASNGDLYAGFWALRYQVAALYRGAKPLPVFQAPHSNVKLLSAFDQTVFESTHQRLDTVQRDFIADFLKKPVGLAFSSQGCKTRWEEVGNDNCVIHFFGHASGSELKFSETDILTSETFQNLFCRTEYASLLPKPILLSFLNGCASVSGRGEAGFLAATAYPGFCGFIGAEAHVPDEFALLFGQELLYLLMIEGLSVRQVMFRLLRKHKPMALFYGCYTHPEFSISSIDQCASLPEAFDLHNFHSGAKIS